MTDQRKATVVLTANTVAFAVCFACWMMNAVLITFLTTNGLFDWSSGQMGMLLATPVLTGSLLRLPVGMLTDRFGGRIVYTILMLLAALALFLNSFATNYFHFLLAALGFGLAGASWSGFSRSSGCRRRDLYRLVDSMSVSPDRRVRGPSSGRCSN